jgi:hypothetical protein
LTFRHQSAFDFSCAFAKRPFSRKQLPDLISEEKQINILRDSKPSQVKQTNRNKINFYTIYFYPCRVHIHVVFILLSNIVTTFYDKQGM